MTVIYNRNPDFTVSPAPRSETLLTMSAEIMARAVNSLVQLGLNVPDRQVIVPAPITIDCEQVVVAFSGWTPQPVAETLMTCDSYRWCGLFSIAVSRATPAMPTNRGLPTVESLLASARMASDDAEALLLLAGSFAEVGPEIAVETPGPEGGYQSAILTVLLPAFGGLS